MRFPWRDRHGRFLPLKAAVLAATFIPGILYAAWWATGALGGRPVTEAIHGTGLWAIRWLLISLAITPFARLLEYPTLLTVRRITGLAALAYASAHFLLYIVDQKFNLVTVATEIALRFYLTIGFIALLALIALGVTSTDGAMKRMGKRWKQLHRLAYPIGLVALLHFYIQTKANVWEPVLTSGLFIWLMVWRAIPMPRRLSAPVLLALIPLSGLATMGLEFAWYGLATERDPYRILTANWNERFFPRPAHEVAAAALVIAVVVLARRFWVKGGSRGGTARVTAR